MRLAPGDWRGQLRTETAYDVFVDGLFIEMAFAFDTVEGWVDYYTGGHLRGLQWGPRRGELEEHRLFGVVTVTPARERRQHEHDE